MQTQPHQDLQKRLVDALLKVPITATIAGRSSLLDGLPDVALTRSETIARLDLNQIISQFIKLGRVKRSGVRPLIVIAENALQYIGEWEGDLYFAFQEIIRDLDRYYGGEFRTNELPAVEPEKLLFKGRDERLPFMFVQKAVEASKCIARIRVPRMFKGKHNEGDNVFGTGWIIAPGVLITNYHVVEARDLRFEHPASSDEFQLQAEHVIVWFDYLREGGTYIECRNADLIASSQSLDYAIMQLREADKISDRKPLQIVEQQPKLQRGHRLNIVQHSGGGPLLYAVRNNFYIGTGNSPDFLRYLTDTEGGASGSPVFDDFWRVLGLHHAATPIPPEYYNNLPQEKFLTLPEETTKGEVVTYHNEGIAIHAILNDMSPEICQKILSAQN